MLMAKVQPDNSVNAAAAIFTVANWFWRIFFGFSAWGGPLEGEEYDVNISFTI